MGRTLSLHVLSQCFQHPQWWTVDLRSTEDWAGQHLAMWEVRRRDHEALPRTSRQMMGATGEWFMRPSHS